MNSKQVAEIAITLARIEGKLEERTGGIIKRLDRLNGTVDQQWSAITKNREGVIRIGTKLENIDEAFDGHRGNPGAHGAQSARIQGSSAVTVALVTGVASIVATAITLLVTHLL